MNTKNISTGQVVTFFCTGRDRQGKKFRKQSDSLNYLLCINAYSDKRIWAVLEGGKRRLIY